MELCKRNFLPLPPKGEALTSPPLASSRSVAVPSGTRFLAAGLRFLQKGRAIFIFLREKEGVAQVASPVALWRCAAAARPWSHNLPGLPGEHSLHFPSPSPESNSKFHVYAPPPAKGRQTPKSPKNPAGWTPPPGSRRPSRFPAGHFSGRHKPQALANCLLKTSQS